MNDLPGLQSYLIWVQDRVAAIESGNPVTHGTVEFEQKRRLQRILNEMLRHWSAHDGIAGLSHEQE